MWSDCDHVEGVAEYGLSRRSAWTIRVRGEIASILSILDVDGVVTDSPDQRP